MPMRYMPGPVSVSIETTIVQLRELNKTKIWKSSLQGMCSNTTIYEGLDSVLESL